MLEGTRALPPEESDQIQRCSRCTAGDQQEPQEMWVQHPVKEQHVSSAGYATPRSKLKSTSKSNRRKEVFYGWDKTGALEQSTSMCDIL